MGVEWWDTTRENQQTSTREAIQPRFKIQVIQEGKILYKISVTEFNVSQTTLEREVFKIMFNESQECESENYLTDIGAQRFGPTVNELWEIFSSWLNELILSIR